MEPAHTVTPRIARLASECNCAASPCLLPKSQVRVPKTPANGGKIAESSQGSLDSKIAVMRRPRSETPPARPNKSAAPAEPVPPMIAVWVQPAALSAVLRTQTAIMGRTAKGRRPYSVGARPPPSNDGAQDR